MRPGRGVLEQKLVIKSSPWWWRWEGLVVAVSSGRRGRKFRQNPGADNVTD